MKRPGGEGYVPISQRLANWYASMRGKGKREQHTPLKPVEPTQQNQFKQAMVTYLADRQRLRQQGYLHERYGEPSNISLADAYHNDLTALAFGVTDADTPSAQAVRKTGNHLRVLDQFELFGFAHFSFPKENEIINGWIRRIELNKREGYPQSNRKVKYPGEELEVVAMLLARISFPLDYPQEGWELAPSEVESAWKAVIARWKEPVDQSIEEIARGRHTPKPNPLTNAINHIKRWF